MSLLNMNYHLYKPNFRTDYYDKTTPFYNSKGKRTKPQKRKFKRGAKRI